MQNVKYDELVLVVCKKGGFSVQVPEKMLHSSGYGSVEMGNKICNFVAKLCYPKTGDDNNVN